MRRRSAGLALLLCCLVLAAGAAGASAPTVEVRVGGSSVADGGTYTTREDPTLSVNASAAGAATLSALVVHVDGEPRRTVETNATTLSRTFDLSYHYGDNRVEVVATDSADRTTSVAFTVRKDDHAPWINLSSPYGVAPRVLIPDREVHTSVVTLAGTFRELTRVTAFRMRSDHEGSGHLVDRAVEEPGGNFSQRLVLGEGNNSVTLYAEDRLGNLRRFEFTLDLNDTDTPNVTVRALPAETNESRVVLRGWVTDGVHVESATLEVNRSGRNGTWSRDLAEVDRYSAPDHRRNVSFEQVVWLAEGRNNLTITATDGLGHNTTVNATVTYRDGVPDATFPRVSVDRNRTAFESKRRLRVRGLVEGEALTHVAVQASAANGTTVGYALLHDGDGRPRVPVNATVATAGNATRIVVRGVDAEGDQRERTFWVNAGRNATFTGLPVGGPEPTPEPTPTPRRIVRTRTGTAVPGTETVVRTRVVRQVRTVRVPAATNRSGPLAAVLGVLPAPALPRGLGIPVALAGATAVGAAGVAVAYRRFRGTGE